MTQRDSLAQNSNPSQAPHTSSIPAPAPAVSSSSSVTKVPSIHRVLLFSEPCFLSGDSDGGDSYCEESTEEAQISVLFSLLVMSGCCPACIGDLFRMDVLVRLPVIVFLLR